MDELAYVYDSGNKLVKVTDAIIGTAGDGGFKDGINTGIDYTYDENGNMLTDANKGIINISYNYLNLPSQVTFATDRYIDYIYDATGMKLQKIVMDTGNSTKTNYAGNYIYEDNGTTEELKFFNQPEGYVEPTVTSSGVEMNYIYQYKDHLGNIRLSYKNTGTISSPVLEIQEENNYYPFGLKHKGYNNVITSTNIALKYKFGGKEYQDELGLDWYDITARNYDPALGRWMNIDPLAEQMRRHSPYNYAFNNPIYFIDADGMTPLGRYDGGISWGKTDEEEEKEGDENGEQEEDCCNGLLDLIIAFTSIGKESDEMSNSLEQTNYTKEEIEQRDITRKLDGLKSFNESIKNLKPDAVGIDVNLSLGAFSGSDHTFNAIWILKGKSASLYPYVFYSSQGHISDGTDFSLTIGGSMGKYYGDRDKSVGDIPGNFYSGETGFGLGGVSNVTYTHGIDSRGNTSWVFGSLNFGVGLNLSPTSAANIKAGKGRTKSIFNY